MSPKRVAPSVRRPWMLCAAAFLAIAWSATLPARAADADQQRIAERLLNHAHNARHVLDRVADLVRQG